jgi:hypothetical protein
LALDFLIFQRPYEVENFDWPHKMFDLHPEPICSQIDFPLFTRMDIQTSDAQLFEKCRSRLVIQRLSEVIRVARLPNDRYWQVFCDQVLAIDRFMLPSDRYSHPSHNPKFSFSIFKVPEEPGEQEFREVPFNL